MKCMECGKGRMRRALARTDHEIRGVKFKVEGEALVCSKCGFVMIPSGLIGEHARLVDAGYRKAAGLLVATQIREARKRLGMTQREFAEYLGVGEASVKRWELGSLQDKSSDILIRLMTDPDFAQENLEQLCRRLGRKSPTEPQREMVFVHCAAGFQKYVAAWRIGGPSFQPSATLDVFSLSSAVN